MRILISILGLIWVLALAFQGGALIRELINYPSDFSVFCGVLLFPVLITACYKMGMGILRWGIFPLFNEEKK